MKKSSLLLQALRDGAPEAFQDIYRTCYHRAAAAVLKHGGTEADAEDIFQEALFVLLRQLRKPEFQLQAKLSSWLYGVCHNLWLKKLRDQNPEVHGLEDEQWASLLPVQPDSAGAAGELEALAMQAVQALSDECRSVIMLAYFEELSDRAIAQKLGYQYDSVRVKRFRCMKNLRQLFHQIQSR
jgi:RNA polymerase sigma factor (sigma-70 family)